MSMGNVGLALTLGVNWPAVVTGLMVVAFLFVCLVLILTVLIQRPQGGGLSGAFGSAAGSSQTAFGAKTGDVLTIFTIAVFVLFLASAVALNWRVSPPPPTVPTAVGLDDQTQQPDKEKEAQKTGSEEQAPGQAEIEPFQLPEETQPGADQQQPPASGEASPPAAGDASPPPAAEKTPPASGPSKQPATKPQQQGASPSPPASEEKPPAGEGAADEKPPAS